MRIRYYFHLSRAIGFFIGNHHRKEQKMTENISPLLVDLEGLQKLTGSGKLVSKTIAREAGAKIKIGRRVLYDVKKIQDFLASSDNIRIAT